MSILIARRAREEMLGANLFAEPAWDILLELYAAVLGGRRMTLNDVATAIGIPEPTAARWIAALNDHGLVTSHINLGQRSAAVTLTQKGASQMKQLADHWRSAFLSI